MVGHGNEENVGSTGTNFFTVGPEWSVPYIDGPIGNGSDSIGGKISYRLGALILQVCKNDNDNAKELGSQNNGISPVYDEIDIPGWGEVYFPFPDRIARHWGDGDAHTVD